MTKHFELVPIDQVQGLPDGWYILIAHSEQHSLPMRFQDGGWVALPRMMLKGYLRPSEGGPASMRWVKASEIFMPEPVRNNIIRVRFSEHGRHSINGTQIKSWDDEKLYMHDGSEFILTNIEWLSESPTQPSGTIELTRELAADAFDAGERYGKQITKSYIYDMDVTAPDKQTYIDKLFKSDK